MRAAEWDMMMFSWSQFLAYALYNIAPRKREYTRRNTHACMATSEYVWVRGGAHSHIHFANYMIEEVRVLVSNG
jgi:hypothetical protein